MADASVPQRGYGQPATYDDAPVEDGQQQQGLDGRAGGKKKKDRYAGQAYAFGAGANTGAQPQQPPAPAAFGAQPGAAQYGGYGQEQQQQQQPGYGQPAYGQPAYGGAEGYPAAGAQPAYGQQTSYGGAPVGGYQAPQQTQQGYSAAGAVGAITQGMGQMGFGGAQRPAEPTAGGPALQLNRLQTTDLISQPFHVSELDLPPPTIILPPNVR